MHTTGKSTFLKLETFFENHRYFQESFVQSIKFLHIQKNLNRRLVPLPFSARSTRLIKPHLKTKLHAQEWPERYEVYRALNIVEHIKQWLGHNRKRISKLSKDFPKNATVFQAPCQSQNLKQHVIL